MSKTHSVNPHCKIGKERGFTLIEVLVTVAIVGIIAGIAFPLYTQQTIKGYRSDAVFALSTASSDMEKCYTNTGAYDDAACVPTSPSPQGHYTIAVVAAAETYTLTATAIGTQANDADCTTLTLTHLGQKGYSGTSPSARRCWGE